MSPLPEDRLAPFVIGSGKIGVVCIHGFTGTPYEMRETALFLAGSGFRASNVKLPGHAEDEHALGRTRWPDWWGAVTRAYRDLAAECERVFVCGLSAGGLLGLHLAAHYPVAAAAVYAVPLRLENPLLRFVPWLKHVYPVHEKGQSDIKDYAARAVHPHHGGFPLTALESFLALQRHVEGDLAEVRCPLFLVYSRQDRTVPFENLAEVERRVGSPDRARLVLERSGHVITVDVDKAEVMQATLEFFQRYL